MKRHLFFVFDRLRITRAERISLLSLTAVLLATLLGGAALQPVSDFDESYYAQADSLFRALSQEKGRLHADILARYQPAVVTDNTAAEAALALRPERQETSPPSKSKTEGSGREASKIPSPESISLNKSDAAELAKLPGIGPKTAEAIVVFRQQNGAFKDLSQVTKVKGIGPKKWEQIRPYLRLD